MKPSHYFPGDALVLGSSFWIRRIGRDEWLDDDAQLTDDPSRSAEFESREIAETILRLWVEEPKLWVVEQCFVAMR
jgi:hypothetical protein